MTLPIPPITAETKHFIPGMAPMVGASLEVMKNDSERMRKGKDFLFTSLVSEGGADAVIAWIKKNVLMEDLL